MRNLHVGFALKSGISTFMFRMRFASQAAFEFAHNLLLDIAEQTESEPCSAIYVHARNFRMAAQAAGFNIVMSWQKTFFSN